MASISFDYFQLFCPVCQDLMKDPVTISCGHNFCMKCINDHWDQEDERRIYSCPQCREKFNPRPVLRRNDWMAGILERMNMKTIQALSSAAGSGDVECDFCTGTKLKAIKSCLMCLSSFCEAHLKPHYEVPGLKKHKLVKAYTLLQEKICSQHNKRNEVYCRTDQTCICYMCTMEGHKGHNTVSAVTERTNKEEQLKKMQRKIQQRVQEKHKKLRVVKQTVVTIKRSAQSAVKDSEKIFTDLIRSIEKKRSEVIKQIRDQEKTELSRAEELVEKLEQQIADLKRRNTELEKLKHTEDHIHFLQSFQCLCVSSGFEDSSSFTVHQQPSFDGVMKSVSKLKERIQELCKSPPRDEKSSPAVGPKDENLLLNRKAAAVQTSSTGPKTREDFLQYFHQLTLVPDTANRYLVLSENNRVVTFSDVCQLYSDHPERFDCYTQVLCEESVSGRCYWEVEWSSVKWPVYISVCYKDIYRKGEGNETGFGYNRQSWSLECSPSSSLSFWHNNNKTKISAPSSSRIGVYVDHSAGTLSFYSISDTITLLHTINTTFTQPLYAGFSVGGILRLCDKPIVTNSF